MTSRQSIAPLGAESTASPGGESAAPLPGVHRGTVLCVDDDEEVLTSVETLLGEAGYEVTLAQSGRRALRIISITRPDLLLLDLAMPEMDAYEVCAKLQQSKDLSYLPVVLLTAAGDPTDKARAMALGAVDYLAKPVHGETLLEKVAAHVSTNAWWQELQTSLPAKRTGRATSDLALFKQSLARQFALTPEQQQEIAALRALEIYHATTTFGVPPAKVAQHMAEFLKLAYHESLSSERLALGVLPPLFCKTNLVLALGEREGDRCFVVSDPFDWELLQLLRKARGQLRAPKLGVTEPSNILALFEGSRRGVAALEAVRQPAGTPGQARHAAEEFRVPDEELRGSEEVTEQSAPIIRLVNQLIENAYAMGASDIHVEPGENEVVVRYRIDGNLRVVHRFPQPRLIHPLVARVKIMADLDIVERRLPQDGRIVFRRFSGKGLDFDLRIATAPMNFGEKVVMRILDKRKAVLPLTELGLSPRHLRLYHQKIQTPYGMILHVGPTGSGKSMTLYAALNEIQRPDINIQTAEDPIEYTLAGINQLQIHREIGLTFERVLRSYLRQDPDVILVGEIRDRETAEIAVEAALTGHVLLSTLHTNDAASTIVRLMEMGIEPFLVSSSIVLICAQRLLRRLCPACKQPHEPTEEERRLVGVPAGTLALYRAVGCEACNGIGYKGRIGTHEILVPDDRLRRTITTPGVTAEALKRQAVEEVGMTTLYWDAMEKVRTGICSLEDTLTEVREDEFDSRPAWMRAELGPEHSASARPPASGS